MSYRIGYARVSRDEQTTKQQVEALEAAGCDKIFMETASGANRDRPELAKLLAMARKGDTIVIWKLDRLARSIRHLTDLADQFKERGIDLVSLTDAIDTSTASGRLTFNMLASIAQFERDLIIERTNAGLARARKEGRVGGRQKTDQAKIDVAFANIGRGMNRSKAAREAGISRSTLLRAIRASKTVESGNGHSAAKDTLKDAGKRYLNGSGGHSAHLAS